MNTFNDYISENIYIPFPESAISQFLIDYCPTIDIKNCKKFFKKFGSSKDSEDLRIKTFFLTFYSIAHYLKINDKTVDLENLSKELYNGNENTVCNIIDKYLDDKPVIERIKKDFNMITVWDSTEPFIEFVTFDRNIKIAIIKIFCKMWKHYSNYHIKDYHKLMDKFSKKTDTKKKSMDKNFSIKNIDFSKRFLPKELQDLKIDLDDVIDMQQYNQIKNFL